MSCPHSLFGTPSFCSQCLRADARYISRTPDGQLLVDGVSQGNIADISRARQHAEEQSLRPINRRGT